MPEKTTDTPAPGYDRTVRLVGEWLDTCNTYNTKLTYGAELGYPYTPSGGPRVPKHLTWLAWCSEHNVNPLVPRRATVEAWWREINAAPQFSTQTRLLRARALSAFSLWAVRHNHTNVNIGAWIDQSTAA